MWRGRRAGGLRRERKGMKWCLLKCGKPPDDKLEEHGPRKEVAFVISLWALMLGLEGAGVCWIQVGPQRRLLTRQITLSNFLSSSASCSPRLLSSKETAGAEVFHGLSSPVFLYGWGPSYTLRATAGGDALKAGDECRGGCLPSSSSDSEIILFQSMSNSFHLHPVPGKTRA